jgi:hypothetical protein
MKNYWFCRCDEGHEQVFYMDAEKSQPELPALSCSFGHPFVTITKHHIADVVQVTFRPAACVDELTHKVLHANDYYLVVRDVLSGKERVSHHTYKWDELLNPTGPLHAFGALSAEKAWKLMDTLDKR